MASTNKIFDGSVFIDNQIDSLTNSQERALRMIDDFLKSSGKQFVLSGCAGTGKSSLISFIIDKLVGGHAVIAYTGKAVVALKRKGIAEAQTAHSFLYDSRLVYDEKTGRKHFVHIEKTPCEFTEYSYVIVDEASMIDKDIYDILARHNFKVIYIGDHFQLPPINDKFNIMTNPDYVMDDIVRQELDNPIVQMAELARNNKPIPYKKFGRSRRMCGVREDWLPLFSQIITWTNACRQGVNDKVRELRGCNSIVPLEGERMIVRDNNRRLGIFNGQIVFLTKDASMVNYGGKTFYNADFVDELVFDDVFALAHVDEPVNCIATLGLEKGQIYDYMENVRMMMKSKSAQRKLKEIGYKFAHLDYGYAITCHAAQGSSWKNVCVIDELRFHSFDNYYRWLYTAITRAEETITICTTK